MSFADDQVATNRKCFFAGERANVISPFIIIRFYCPKTLNYLAFQSFNFEQKRIVCTIFDIYVYIIQKSQKMGQVTFKLVH